MPMGPTRFGPRRSCIHAESFRSSRMRYEIVPRIAPTAMAIVSKVISRSVMVVLLRRRHHMRLGGAMLVQQHAEFTEHPVIKRLKGRNLLRHFLTNRRVVEQPAAASEVPQDAAVGPGAVWRANRAVDLLGQS